MLVVTITVMVYCFDQINAVLVRIRDFLHHFYTVREQLDATWQKEKNKNKIKPIVISNVVYIWCNTMLQKHYKNLTDLLNGSV